ncbi:MAG: hypothetical protein HYU36_11500 [Planctomycetes bacterium]|nr:hypothetical protein [Planctomycetota bacterium]
MPAASLLAEAPAPELLPGQTLNWNVSFAIPMPGPLVAFGAAVLVLLTFLLYLKILRAFPARRAVSLIVLRTLALVALFFSALQPTVSHDLVVPRRTHLVLLMDTSKSMTITDVRPELQPAGPRGEKAATALSRAETVLRSIEETGWLRALEKRFQVHPFVFDSFARPVGTDEWLRRPSEGEFTDIGGALRSATGQVEGEIQGIVLITDGADNSRQPLSAQAGELKLPITAVGVGDSSPGEDAQLGRELAVASVEYNKRVVLNERATIRVNVYHREFQGPVPVELRVQDSALDAQTADLRPDAKNTWVTLHFTPASEGLFTYHVAIPPQPGEKTVSNNLRKITIEVHQEETRVLYLAGEPSYDYRFIKHLIEEDPILSFTGLVRFSAERVYRQGRWPKDQALDLQEFQVVILANLDKDFFNGEQLELLRKRVEEEGTGLILLGGPGFYAAGGYAGTALARALPADLKAEPDRYEENEYEVQLTPEGNDHPVFRFLSDPVKNREFWAELPRGSGLNLPLKAKPGASVLALARTGGVQAPFLLAHTYGKGRCLALAGRYTWPWRGSPAGLACFERFWGQALRWAAAREEMRLKEGERLRFWTDKDDYYAGDEVRFEALLTDERGKLTSTADVVANVITPEKQQTPVSLVSTEELGRFRGSYLPKAGGHYEIEVVARHDDFLLGSARSQFTVGSTLAELDQPQMNASLLQLLASRTGGAYLPVSDIARLPESIPAGRQTELQPVSEEVWSHPYFLVIFFALLTAEWILRKRFHMV